MRAERLIVPGTVSVEQLVGDVLVDVLVPLAGDVVQVRCVALKWDVDWRETEGRMTAISTWFVL